MNVRFKTKAERKVARKVANDITRAIQAMIFPGDSNELKGAIGACAIAAYQWAWQNAESFSRDMKWAAKTLKRIK